MQTLKIECVGEGSPRARPYGVWDITGLGGEDGFFRKTSVRPQKDYASANSVGTRGVYAYYLLQSEHIYEVLQPTSWNKSDHYYIYVDVETIVRLTIEEVFAWLKNRSALTY